MFFYVYTHCSPDFDLYHPIYNLLRNIILGQYHVKAIDKPSLNMS